uniref:Reverse transcriptase domain-containing protein n=1 Tax=Nothobranchius furzeri TaxID=105023 RepID=A0A8C6PAU3_NOTFU
MPGLLPMCDVTNQHHVYWRVVQGKDSFLRLEHCVGISGLALQWIKSYLSGRNFCVGLGDCSSDTADLQCGVPQGSVLAPLLFSLYLLPLGDLFRQHNDKFHLYADDCQIYLPVSGNNSSSFKPLLDCLEEVKLWMAQNLLFFNQNKSETILFCLKYKHGCARGIDSPSLAPFEKAVVTNLGVKLDVELTLDTQVNGTIRSCYFHLRRIARIKPLLSRKHLETVINAFITTRLDYCNSLYAGIKQASIAKPQKVQNAAARLLTGTRRSEHITPVLASLHWLPVSFRISFKVLVFVFKCLNELAPRYLADLIHPYVPARNLRSAQQGLLVIPKHRLQSRGGRVFSVLGPRLWNELPTWVKQATTLCKFKSQLKTHFFL